MTQKETRIVVRVVGTLWDWKQAASERKSFSVWKDSCLLVLTGIVWGFRVDMVGGGIVSLGLKFHSYKIKLTIQHDCRLFMYLFWSMWSCFSTCEYYI